MTRYLDTWSNQRQQAIEEGGLKILRGTMPDGRVTVLIWRPKAIKPCANYYFRSADRLEEFVAKQIGNNQAHAQMIEERKINRAGTPEDLAKVQVGSIFHYSWGYDQTNCDFFQVTEIRGRRITLREIGQDTVEGSQGFMTDSRLAVKDRFLDKAEPFTKLLQFSGGTPHISMDYGWCSLWDGKPESCSWYA